MITEGRVKLRRVEPADYPLIHRWQNSPEVFRWMDYIEPFSLENIRISEEQAAREGYPFIIEAEGRPVGRIGINQVRPRDRVGSVYMFIGEPDVWGKGFGRQALQAVLGYGFSTLNLNLVELWTLAKNDRAIRLYKSVGMVEDARLRDRSFNNGAYDDRIVMSITREEFERQTRT